MPTHIDMQQVILFSLMCIPSYRPPCIKFINPLRELGAKLIEFGNPKSNIIVTGDLHFPILNLQLEATDGGTRESETQANAPAAICAETMLTTM